MTAISRSRRASILSLDALRQMVGPDKHRPGPARARLVAEQVPVWALSGHAGAVAKTPDPTAITDEVVAQVAEDYDISVEAMWAALLYDYEHRGAIDALLEANAAALE